MAAITPIKIQTTSPGSCGERRPSNPSASKMNFAVVTTGPRGFLAHPSLAREWHVRGGRRVRPG